MVGFPLLLIPLAIYNIIVFLMPGVSFADPLVKLTLMSGAEWPVTLSDVLLALGILLLLFEVIKGARPGAKYLTDHLLSLIVFGAAAAEFVLWPKFGTSTYFLLTVLSLVDFLSGLALRTRRGAVAVAAPRSPERAPERPRRRRPNPNSIPRLRRTCAVACRRQPRSPNPCCRITPSRNRRNRRHARAARRVRSRGRAAASSPEVPSPGLQPGAARRRRRTRRRSAQSR